MPRKSREDPIKPYQVTNSEEGRALAALGAGRPGLAGGAVRVQVVLRADQEATLKRQKVNRSELIRELLDRWIAENPA